MHNSLLPSLLLPSLGYVICYYLRTDRICILCYNSMFHRTRLMSSVWAVLRIIACFLLSGLGAEGLEVFYLYIIGLWKVMDEALTICFYQTSGLKYILYNGGSWKPCITDICQRTMSEPSQVPDIHVCVFITVSMSFRLPLSSQLSSLRAADRSASFTLKFSLLRNCHVYAINLHLILGAVYSTMVCEC